MRQNQFNPNIIDLGEVRIGKTTTVIFKSGGLDLEVDNITTSCGCTGAKMVVDNLEVKFTPKKMSPHLAAVCYYISTQSINVTYVNGDIELLMIKAKAIQ